MLGDGVQSQHFRFLSAQLADVAAHLRAVLREVSDKQNIVFYIIFKILVTTAFFGVLRIRIRGLFDPWIRDPGWVESPHPDPG